MPAFKIGRPTTRTEPIVNHILAEICDGRSVRKILTKDALEDGTPMPARSTWHEWLLADTELQAAYVTAKTIGCDNIFDEIKDISDEPITGEKVTLRDGKKEVVKADMTDHRRLQVTTRMWWLSQIFPEKYGDRRKVEHSGSLLLKHEDALKELE